LPSNWDGVRQRHPKLRSKSQDCKAVRPAPDRNRRGETTAAHTEGHDLARSCCTARLRCRGVHGARCPAQDAVARLDVIVAPTQLLPVSVRPVPRHTNHSLRCPGAQTQGARLPRYLSPDEVDARSGLGRGARDFTMLLLMARLCMRTPRSRRPSSMTLTGGPVRFLFAERRNVVTGCQFSHTSARRSAGICANSGLQRPPAPIGEPSATESFVQGQPVYQIDLAGSLRGDRSEAPTTCRIACSAPQPCDKTGSVQRFAGGDRRSVAASIACNNDDPCKARYGRIALLAQPWPVEKVACARGGK